MSGASTTASMLGQPDLAIATHNDFVQVSFLSLVFPLISSVPAIHGIRAALQSLKATGSDVESAKGMGPKDFFQVMGLDEATKLDREAGGEAFSDF
ncbi:hypothetical protein C0991_006654 [Blastosporella zonata]|nr:hypothetical protein C0991_006654 [Blastosporella zonata]